MEENQAAKHPEFWDCKVRCLDCTKTLVAEYSNTNARFFDHRHVVCAISDRKSQSFLISLLNHPDNISFLTRSQPATHDCLTSLTNRYEIHRKGLDLSYE